jgi:hypothetical protein
MSKIETYKTTTETRENGSTIFWRTGKGSHRHASFYCANSKRDIMTGDCTVIPENQAAEWTACVDCCTDADVLEGLAATAKKADAMCPNNKGVAIPRRIYSTCNVCGKEGKVNRSTGSIRAHKPQA